MRYLIDGYNLMYALGLVRTHGGRAGWDRGRRQLLGWLADQAGPRAPLLTVAFDAQNARGGIIEERHRGLRVVRDRGRAADDLIEDLLRTETDPDSVTVVSNDRRVLNAAITRGCRTLRCGDFVDSLLTRATATQAVPADEKDVRPQPDELARWLQDFGG